MPHFDPIDFALSYHNEIPKDMMHLVNLIRVGTAECTGVPIQLLETHLSSNEFMHLQTEEWDDQVFFVKTFARWNVEIAPIIPWLYPGSTITILRNDQYFDNFGKWVKWVISEYLATSEIYIVSCEGERKKQITFSILVDYLRDSG